MRSVKPREQQNLENNKCRFGALRVRKVKPYRPFFLPTGCLDLINLKKNVIIIIEIKNSETD